MSTRWFYSFKRWGDLRDWVIHHEHLFKKRSFNRSTASDFEFSKSKWDQFYKLTKKAKLPFELMVYTHVSVGSGNLNFTPKEVRFITVVVGGQEPPKEHALYNKRAWKAWVSSQEFKAEQNTRSFNTNAQQIVDEDWNIKDEEI